LDDRGASVCEHLPAQPQIPSIGGASCWTLSNALAVPCALPGLHPRHRHALVYSHVHRRLQVNGVLVGSRTTTADGTSTSTVISRVAPMIHTHTSLPGQMDIAIAMLEERLKDERARAERAGDATTAAHEVLGYYQCNERRDDVELGAVGRRIADAVGSTALVLDAGALAAMQRGGELAKLPFVLYAKPGGSGGSGGQGWGKRPSALRVPCLEGAALSGVVERLLQAVDAGDFGGVHDFEEHMEDVRVEFLH